ncbi:unnamed protein product [Paramecium sonneborni]|uniref:Uncharacterized protein n=1 Tax=Paramecium sonneborni TaxID=65129 RepID=A0A8S1MPB6_9CILI|nr:unnamed protein product [Paramecium sonneborni]
MKLNINKCAYMANKIDSEMEQIGCQKVDKYKYLVIKHYMKTNGYIKDMLETQNIGQITTFQTNYEIMERIRQTIFRLYITYIMDVKQVNYKKI